MGAPNDIGSGPSQGLGTAVAWLRVLQCSRCLCWVSWEPSAGSQRLLPGTGDGGMGWHPRHYGPCLAVPALCPAGPCALLLSLGLHLCHTLCTPVSAPHTPTPPSLQPPKAGGDAGQEQACGQQRGAGGPCKGSPPQIFPSPPGFCRARPPAGSPWPVKRTRGKRSQRCQMQIASRVTHPNNGVRLILLQWD